MKDLLKLGRKRKASSDSENIWLIHESGLFNEEWYKECNPDVVESGENPLIHFYYHGFREGRNPSYLFDANWYLETYRDVKDAGIHPLVHYIQHGEVEGRNPSPCVDIEYVRRQVSQPIDGLVLSYFYAHVAKDKLSPLPEFSMDYYLSANPDIEESGMDPYFHFLFQGVNEGRNPSILFDLAKYKAENNLTDNPFWHYLTVGKARGLPIRPVGSAQPSSASTGGLDLLAEITRYRGPGEGYEDFQYKGKSMKAAKVKALAYYLPQFHPFKENSEWWGEGFTEWTNVTRGLPRFKGHYQPHLPRDLGYYDLRLKDTLKAQAEMAQAAGLHGFCFYHYWFNGKRLMDSPVNMLMDSPEIELPFCILWANENWTRTWDGLENNVLIAQDYHDEDDIAFIRDIGRHFADPRYIRVDGHPLFFIYRPGIIPDAVNRIKKWRKLSEELLGEAPLFYMAQAFGDNDPEVFGMDGAVEFPPHKLAQGLDSKAQELGLVDPGFTGHYPLYDELVQRSLEVEKPDFDLIRAVTPSWDNEARKPGRGMGFIDSTPAKYERWLASMVKYAEANPIGGDESFVVINAWNEWAEGAHLEPDVYWGSAYLNATYRAVHGLTRQEGKTKLVLVGHDAYKHGAQLLTLNIFKTLVQDFGIDVELVLLDGGPLVKDYQKIGKTHVAHGDIAIFRDIVKEITGRSTVAHAICNTTVSGQCTEVLADSGLKVISLVHELETLIKEYALEDRAKAIAENAASVVFASSFVKDSFERVVGSIGEKAVIKPQGIYQKLEPNSNSHKSLRKKLNLPGRAKIVVNAGFADLRKGFDLFVSTARVALAKSSDYHFVWLGNVEPGLKNWILRDIAGSELESHLHIVPFTSEISLYLQGADAFAMTSREDPFPSVVLESLALGTPVVGFQNGGGFAELLRNDSNGALVPMGDVNALFDAIDREIANDSEAHRAARSAWAIGTFEWRDYVFSLVELLMPELRRVSVVVPNYNYEDHIGPRLETIFAQNYPVYEVIVLDDKSSDNSVSVIQETADLHQREIQLIVNEKNSGSVFRQWDKGARLAKGELLWIAEADDLAAPDFVSELVSDDAFDLAYCDSRQVDQDGNLLAESYNYYFEEFGETTFAKSFRMPGKEFLAEFLAVKNIIMNVSGVIFRTSSLCDALDRTGDRLYEYSVAGDWFLYTDLLASENALIKYCSKSLNTHRRHQGSVTHSLKADKHLSEISSVQGLVNRTVSLTGESVHLAKLHFDQAKRHLGVE
ncbi:glycoside hydrolase family 99-like domain-containing protein [Microbulbifer sp. Q7]|uniref:glycoside hydrolase family 99-like domain-containing protein n=1 Tax=Microbulbifer sp. Q7 TaxID=1785091 RepID=UPI00187BFAD4|nr:glycoside hydrolase family 99-like domain-containing protein [Microbulbifer sp. Q7]